MLTEDDRREVEGLIAKHNADLLQRLQDGDQADRTLNDFVRSTVESTPEGVPGGASDIKPVVLVTIFIPSSTREDFKVKISPATQTDWRKAAMALMGKHFKGATSLGGLHEGLWAEEGEEDVDFPVLVQAYAAHDELMKEAAMKALKDFMHLMAEELCQDTTLLVIGGQRLIFSEDSGRRKAYYDHLKTVEALEKNSWMTDPVAHAFARADGRRKDWVREP